MNVPLFIFAFLALITAGIVVWRIGLKSTSIFLAAVPVGIVIYFGIGVFVARILKSGRFYSVPFGGFKVGGQDWALIASGSFWIVLSFVIFRIVLEKRRRKP